MSCFVAKSWSWQFGAGAVGSLLTAEAQELGPYEGPRIRRDGPLAICAICVGPNVSSKTHLAR